MDKKQDKDEAQRARWVTPEVVDVDPGLSEVAAGDGATNDGMTVSGTS
ncbi:MAG: hypothetical protein HKN78_02555 [Sphingomonadaceae bacterium]|nr:hypothetical protein [Sphingomonadaceae bacterium]